MFYGSVILFYYIGVWQQFLHFGATSHEERKTLDVTAVCLSPYTF